MSDWYGTRSGLPSIAAGLDLEMPGPSVFRGHKLVEDVLSGRINEAAIDERLANVLTLTERAKPSWSSAPEESLVDEEAIELSREIAMEGVVLLQNRKSVLPLRNETMAIIGNSAIYPAIGGGGSAEAPPQYTIRPFDSIRGKHPHPERVNLHHGVKVHNAFPCVPSDQIFARNGLSGVDVQYFNDGVSAPVFSEFSERPAVVMLGRVKPGLDGDSFSYVISTCLVPRTSGTHFIAIQSTGNFVLKVNEKEVFRVEMKGVTVEDFLFKPKHLERVCEIPLEAGVPYFLELTVRNHPGMGTGEPCVHAAKLCYMEAYSDDESIADAVAIASTADVSIIFAGRTAEHESEGFDLVDIKLPANQVKMIKAVAAASRRTVLVLSCGNPIDVQDFVDDVDSILCTHYLGQESGPALAEILFGKCPSGRLATTWPKRLEDSPSFANFPATNGPAGYEMTYAEGINVGYRSKIVPQWAFGFGLSYTSFVFSDLHITRGEEMTVEVTVTNTGATAGSEVVQLYVESLDSSIYRPRELKAFAKVHVEAMSSAKVNLSLDAKHAFSAWSENEVQWVAEAGDYKIYVGTLSESIRLQETIKWSGL
jgi:beta-glucosidase